MHVVFIPYGKRESVERLLRDMEAQKHFLKIYKVGEKDKGEWLQGVLRLSPFGIYEYVFPKEDLELVLTTLTCDTTPYHLPKLYLKMLKKILKLKPFPKYKKEKHFLWIREDVSIIPLGIREDVELTEKEGPYKGWTHEAL